jgi:hypothetical protein
MPALALTDRDGLYGAVKHAVACQAAGVAPDRRVRRSRTRHAPCGTQVPAAPVAGRHAPDGGVAGTGSGAPLVALVWCRAFQGNLRDSDLEYAA